MTALDELNAVPPHVSTPESDPYNVGADLDAPIGDLRTRVRTYANRDPEVLVVGGGHAGICAAAWLGHLGIDTLVVDTMSRIGDNWRTRYHNLKLHNERDSNHLPFLPFPRNWPRYIAKDKLPTAVKPMLRSWRLISGWRPGSTVHDISQKSVVGRRRYALPTAPSASFGPGISSWLPASAALRIPPIPALANFQGLRPFQRL